MESAGKKNKNILLCSTKTTYTCRDLRLQIPEVLAHYAKRIKDAKYYQQINYPVILRIRIPDVNENIQKINKNLLIPGSV